ncbi:hypothetical protein GC177_09790 [bacterium]|nr:hypothetical protein [bacterium]
MARFGHMFGAALLAATLLAQAPSAMADDAASKQEQAKKIIQTMMLQYVGITGAHYIDERCHHLQGEQKKQFESDRINSMDKFRSVLKMDETVLSQIDQKSQETAKDEKRFPCGGETQKFVTQSIPMAKQLSDAMNMLEASVKNQPKS